MGLSHSFVKAGALFALSCDYTANGMKAGEIANRIMKGEKPGGINIATPCEKCVRLSINLKTAKHIGLSLSEEVVKSADDII